MPEMTDHGGHQHALSYADAVEQYRASKDAYFRAGAGSPIPAADRAAFTGLPYYPVSEAFVIDDLELEPYPDAGGVNFEIETTDGQRRLAERAGRFRFELDGAEQMLTAYRLSDKDGVLQEDLFVPFQDATTGTETYGAGRYLDIEAQEDGTWSLDFNMAYHPSCVYDARFSCPITPAENRLRVRVEAGERLGPDGH
jgi:uncharacterized protein